ncbi:MAG: NUDIX domain-containing protein [Dehalococcoidia bacterium]|nr:NUDIX domain-containing protein [Dehalococcoidia bacterium]
MERHFTVSGFVSEGGRTALHWHRHGLWLPPGGHIERDEDPVQAVIREVLEETELHVQVLGQIPLGITEPPQLPPPVTIGVYDIPRDSRTDGPHQHIDFVYFTRPLPGSSLQLPEVLGWTWVDEQQLREGATLTPPDGPPTPIPDDVRRLGLAAIAAAAAAATTAV